MIFFLALIAATDCQELGRLAQLKAYGELQARTVATSETSPPCERYAAAIAALRATDSQAQPSAAQLGRARALLRTLVKETTAFSDWAKLRLAETEWRLGEASVGVVTQPAFPRRQEIAMLLLASSALQEPRAAEKLLSFAVTAREDRQKKLELLAELSARRTAAPKWTEEVKRELFVEFPESPKAPLAFPAASTADLLGRAAVAAESHMNEDVLKATRAALKLGVSAEQRCRALFLQGAATRKLRQYTAAEELLVSAKEACAAAQAGRPPRVTESDDVAELEKRAWYLLGQVQAIARPRAVATRTLLDFAARFRGDALVDDALFQAAASAHKADAPEAQALYDQVAALEPPGDMCAEARFRAAYALYRRGAFSEALARFAAIGAGGCGSDDYERGRGLYWEARSRERAGEAKSAWAPPLERLLAIAPLSFYALLARARLGVEHPILVPKASSEAQGSPRLFSGEAAKRARALVALGLFEEAQLEIRALEPGLEAADRLAYAELLSESGDHFRAHMLFRTSLREVIGSVPTAENERAWRIAYPRPFAAVIRAAEVKAALPADLLLSLIREESAFMLDAGSWANAFGLTQLLVSTAQGTAKDMKLTEPISAERLKTEPKLAIEIGAHHLVMLRRRFELVPMVLASYNAGETAVARWSKARGGLPIDEFIEEIPLDETRGYVKRILRSWAIYRALSGAPLPRVDASARAPG